MRNSSCHQSTLTFSRFGNANRVASDALENLATLSNILLLFVLWDRLPLCSPGCPKMYNSLASVTLVSDDKCEPSCLPLKISVFIVFLFYRLFCYMRTGFCPHIWLCITCMPCTFSAEGIRFPENRTTDGHDLPQECWKLNLGSLTLTTDPFLQHRLFYIYTGH